jgi:hypothetical protein
MSDAHKIFTALSEVKEAWIQKDLTKANYLEFDEAMLLAAQAALPDQENAVMGLLMTQAEWNTIPANVLGPNQFVPLPDIPRHPWHRIPEAGAQVAVELMYERALLANDKAVMQRLHLIQAAGFLKELYKNEAVLGRQSALPQHGSDSGQQGTHPVYRNGHTSHPSTCRRHPRAQLRVPRRSPQQQPC